MDNVGDNLSPRGLFLFREHYYPKKPNLSKIFSYVYIVFALALIIAYCSPINGLRCSTQTYVSACEKDIITSDQCNNLLIVDCELDCDKKGIIVIYYNYYHDYHNHDHYYHYHDLMSSLLLYHDLIS